MSEMPIDIDFGFVVKGGSNVGYRHHYRHHMIIEAALAPHQGESCAPPLDSPPDL